MKHLIIILFIALGAVTARAQQVPQEKSVIVLLPIQTVKTVLNQAATIISNSNTPWKDANPTLVDLQNISNWMVAMKPDTTLVVKPKTVPTKEKPGTKGQ